MRSMTVTNESTLLRRRRQWEELQTCRERRCIPALVDADGAWSQAKYMKSASAYLG